MKIILHDQRPGICDILALRAAQKVINEGSKFGAVAGIRYEDGSTYAIRVNKDSVSVWPQRKDEQPT